MRIWGNFFSRSTARRANATGEKCDAEDGGESAADSVSATSQVDSRGPLTRKRRPVPAATSPPSSPPKRARLTPLAPSGPSSFGRRFEIRLQALKNWVQGIGGGEGAAREMQAQSSSDRGDSANVTNGWKENRSPSTLPTSTRSTSPSRSSHACTSTTTDQHLPVDDASAAGDASRSMHEAFFASTGVAQSPSSTQSAVPIVVLADGDDDDEDVVRVETPSTSSYGRETPQACDEITGRPPVQSMSMRSCRSEDRWSRGATPRGVRPASAAYSGKDYSTGRRTPVALAFNPKTLSSRIASNDKEEKVINLEARDRYRRLLEEFGSGNVFFTSPQAKPRGLKRLGDVASTRSETRALRVRKPEDALRMTKALLNDVVEIDEEEQSTPTNASESGTPPLVDLTDEPLLPTTASRTARTSTDSPSDRTTPVYDEQRRKDLNQRIAIDADDSLRRWRDEYIPASEARRQRARELAMEGHMRERARQQAAISLEEQLRLRLRLEGVVLYEKEVDEFPELDDDALALIERVWSRGPKEELFAEGPGARLTRKDLLTLRGLDWLNDEVINFYINLVAERSTSSADLPKAYAFSSFFYPRLAESGHAAVARWTRKVDIFAYDLLLVPVHLGAHWCLAVVDLRARSVQYFDSMGGNNRKCLDVLRQYLEAESRDKKKTKLDLDTWKFLCRKDIPQQMNGSDCGVFTCKFAEYVARDASITFTQYSMTLQEHMPYFRQRMVYELCRMKLM